MLSENLKNLRTRNGWSQEELASRLHVVRQTVSKWEKGLSVPDADMLMRLADIFNVPVAALLGGDLGDISTTDEVAAELAKICEQLAVKNRRARRVWKTVVIVLALIIVLDILGLLLMRAAPGVSSSGTTVQRHEPIAQSDA